MLSLNFYYKINYLIKREANFDVFLSYILEKKLDFNFIFKKNNYDKKN